MSTISSSFTSATAPIRSSQVEGSGSNQLTSFARLLLQILFQCSWLFMHTPDCSRTTCLDATRILAREGADALEQFFVEGMHVGRHQQAHVPGESLRPDEVLGRRLAILGRVKGAITK